MVDLVWLVLVVHSRRQLWRVAGGRTGQSARCGTIGTKAIRHERCLHNFEIILSSICWIIVEPNYGSAILGNTKAAHETIGYFRRCPVADICSGSESAYAARGRLLHLRVPESP